MNNKESTITISKSVLIRKNLDESSETDILEVRNFETECAKVSMSIERTVALEPYCSLKMKLEVNVPCYVEEIKDIQKELCLKLPKRLDTLIDNWLKDYSSK